MKAIFMLSLRQTATPRKIAVALILASIPIVLSIIDVVFSEAPDPDGFIEIILERFIAAVILPLLAITVATSTLGNELEDKTLGFIMTKPIARWKIAVPKYASAVVFTIPPIVISSVVVVALSVSTEPTALITVAVAVVLGVITYTSVFMWLGLLTSRALAFALLYVFIWEGLLTEFLGGIRFVSVRGYVLATLNGMDSETFGILASKSIDLYAALIGGALVALVFFFLTVRRLNRMDVP